MTEPEQLSGGAYLRLVLLGAAIGIPYPPSDEGFPLTARES